MGRSRDVSTKVRRGRIDINDVLLLLIVQLILTPRQEALPVQDDLWIGTNDSDVVKAAKSISISTDIISVIDLDFKGSKGEK